MTARRIDEIAVGALPTKARRTYQPVRRNSYHRGDREDRIWRPIAPSRSEARRLIAVRLRAAEEFDRNGKIAGDRNGPLGHIGLEILRHLYRIVDYRTGRLEPCLDTLMQRMRRSRSAIVAAMARLRRHGFLDWIRRTEPIDNPGQGPQVRQISNAYWFDLPATAAALVHRLLGRGATAADLAAKRRREEEQAAMLDAMTAEEQARFFAGTSPLGNELAKLGRALGNDASSPNGQNPERKNEEG